MKYVKLTNTEEMAIVDDDSLEQVSKYKWNLNSMGYAVTKINGQTTLMHRLIVGATKDDGKEIDHVSRYKLDNRKANLRLATHSLNMFNRGQMISRNSIGVSWHKARQKWQARVQLQKKRKSLGLFDNRADAIQAVQQARKELYLNGN